MYAKIFAQIYDGTLCTNGPWEALVTFQQLLVLADEEGHVDMTAGAIARRTTIPLEIILKGIECLIQPDPESRTPTAEGRRIVPLSPDRAWGWLIVNYKHYRQIKREQDRRDYHRDYWHKRKGKDSTAATDSTSTQHAQPNQPIAEAKTEAKKKTLVASAEASSSPSPAPPLKAKDLIAEGVAPQMAADWLTLRRAKRLPLTPTAWDDTKSEGQKAGLSPPDTVAKAVANNWAGFKASWLVREMNGKAPHVADPFEGIH